jgi:Putative prokaryotic signal transducing protein
MKQVSTSMESAELGLLKNMLDGAGIRCVLRNEQLSQALPEAPFNVELWVENDDDLQRAQELCNTWFDSLPGATGIWTCARCGQRIGGQFDSCWKCGTERATTAKLNNEGEDNENLSRFVD